MKRTQSSGLLAILLTAALSGCVGGVASETPTPTPTSSPDASASPSATPTPTAPSAEIAPCETLLTPEENAALQSEGRALSDPARLVEYYPPMQELLDAGGSACLWSKQASDVFVLIAQVALDEDAAATRISQLESAGWARTDDPVAGTLVSPEVPGLNSVPAALYADGVFYLASYAGILGSIAALQ